nr:hypothetical protein Itr_chr02CG16160 [Ipomoea trifida]GMC68418.1 hypothetical protein Iba_chr02fCG11680 [Ipomoea batatas]
MGSRGSKTKFAGQYFLGGLDPCVFSGHRSWLSTDLLLVGVLSEGVWWGLAPLVCSHIAGPRGSAQRPLARHDGSDQSGS